MITSASLALSTRDATHHVVERLGQRGLEAGHVGAALGGGDHVDEGAQLGLVAGPPTHRHVDAELALDVLRGHVPLLVEQRHGLGEGVRALQPEHLGDRLVVAEELAELGDPAVVAERLRDRLGTAQVAVSRARGPGTMNEVCRARVTSSSQANLASRVKTCRSGQNRTRVPVTPFLTRLPLCRPDFALERRPTARRRRTRPGTPRWNDIAWVAGERSTSTSRRAESAFTTEAADTVQATGGGVRAPAELAAGVQLGEDHLDARRARSWAPCRPGCRARRRGPRPSRRGAA